MTWYAIPKKGLIQCHHEPHPTEATEIVLDVQLPIAYQTCSVEEAPTPEEEAAYLATEPHIRKGVRFRVDGQYRFETGGTLYREVDE